MGRMWAIWPVSSKQITAVDTVWLTAPVRAAAPFPDRVEKLLGEKKKDCDIETEHHVGQESYGDGIRWRKRKTWRLTNDSIPSR